MTDVTDAPVEKHYSVHSVAGMFDVGAQTVRLWIREGKLKARKINGRWRIPESELKRLANTRYGKPGDDE